MKKSYTDYLCELSGNRIDVLEELITTKYKKFRKFYHIVSGHSDIIAHIAYCFNESENLDINITLDPEENVEGFMDLMMSEVSEKYSMSVSNEGQVVYVSISTI